MIIIIRKLATKRHNCYRETEDLGAPDLSFQTPGSLKAAILMRSNQTHAKRAYDMFVDY